jgi:uncharacterized membrane protein
VIGVLAHDSLSGLRDVLDSAGSVIDALGVAVIAAGIVISSVLLTSDMRRAPDDSYVRYRQRLGRGILLGLEFLVAGDIIRSVAVSPSFTSVGVLAIIVAVRTFLSFTLELEISGRWPWQPRP